MTAKAHHPGAEAAETDAETVEAATEAPPAAPAAVDTSGPDLANIPAPAGVAGPTGTEITGELTPADDSPLAELKALGNTKPDVNVTAVRNSHGFYTWAARDAESGEEIARSPHSHTEAQLTENLLKLFGTDSVVALRRTGDLKARRLA
jgi:hypothetical protein